jgi:hypothetical protein
LIRECYPELLSTLESSVERHLFITGNSGIGTSTFLFYLASSLHRKEVPVLLIVWDFEAAIYIPATGAPVAYPVDESLHPVFPEICWRLYDTLEPKFLKGRSYVIAGSPGTVERNEKLRQMAKNHRDWRELVMPVWSLDELQTCATLLPDDGDRPSADDVLKAYVVWGGIPRRVLSHKCAVIADVELSSVAAASKKTGLHHSRLERSAGSTLTAISSPSRWFTS